MGYRLRLGQIAKSEKEKFAGKTYEEAEAMMGDDESLYYPKAHTELYQIGKYVDFSEGTQPFYDFDIYEATESEFLIMDKVGLKLIIDSYHEKIHDNFKEMHAYVTASEEERQRMDEEAFYHGGDRIANHFREKADEWTIGGQLGGRILPYRLDEEDPDGEITGSWSYEYAIFNLVYIYRNFDWENNYLIYSGW